MAISDLFSQFLEFKWRGVAFPASTFEVSIRHDVAIHKVPDVDGANVEPTGRDAIVFRAQIPFRNGIVPGKGETWSVLFPTQYRAFLKAFADRTKGTLQHPEMGLIECQPLEIHVTTSADRRDGCDVDATWIETEDAPGDTDALFAGDSPITTAHRASHDLDASLGPARDIFPTLPVFDATFEDMMRGITAFSDQVSLLSKRAAGRIDNVAYRLNTLSDSVDRAESSLTWPTRQAMERLRGALPDLKKTLGTQNKTLVFYTVPKASTLAGIAVDTGAKLIDLVRLNQHLVRGAIVEAKTIVRYYK